MTESGMTKTFDLTDPEQVKIVRADNYVEMYANRTVISVTQWDARLSFLQALSVSQSSDKLEMVERGALTIGHEHLVRLHKAIGEAIEKNQIVIAKAADLEAESSTPPPDEPKGREIDLS